MFTLSKMLTFLSIVLLSFPTVFGHSYGNINPTVKIPRLRLLQFVVPLRIVHFNNNETYNFKNANCECKSYRICIRKRRNRTSTKCRKLHRRTPKVKKDQKVESLRILTKWSDNSYHICHVHIFYLPGSKIEQ